MWEHVQEAVVYLFPGFVAYILLYKPLTGGRTESDLLVTAKSVLWSLAISQLVQLWAQLWQYSIDWQATGTVCWLFVLAVTSGATCGYAANRWRLWPRFWHLLGRDITKYPTVWQEILLEESSGGRVVFVRMKDGGTYYGALTHATEVPCGEALELLVEESYYLPSTQEADNPEWIEIGRPVYILSDAVAALELDKTGSEIGEDELVPEQPDEQSA